MKSLVKCFLLSSLLAAVSCAGSMSENSDTGNPYLDSLLTNNSLRGYGIVSSFDPKANRNAVVVFGDPDIARSICITMVEGDVFDNVNGRKISDALPDFAGETFYAILDEAGLTHYRSDSVKDLTALRESAVRGLVSAMDTSYFKSDFEPEGSMRKLSAKLVVMASPLLELCGKPDIDVLLGSCGADIPVVYPVYSCFETLLSDSGKDISAGVLASAELAGSGVYEKIFREVCTSVGRHSSDVFVSGAGNSLVSFLDDYSSKGYSEPLGALVVDCGSVDLLSYMDELANIRKSETVQDFKYGLLLSDSFRIIDTRIQTSVECYSILRNRNAFAHFISAPSLRYFYSEMSEDGGCKVLEYKN